MQIVGDGTRVSHLWERECSIQRRHQKLVEIAPAPPPRRRPCATPSSPTPCGWPPRWRYGSLGTFEFLVDADTGRHVFIEANPRLQVEHTVTEEVLGLDLVRAQLELAAGAHARRARAGPGDPCRPRAASPSRPGEHGDDGRRRRARPAGGVLTAFEVPSGAGYRTDSFGYAGYRTSTSFDSLLAKVIVHTPSAALPDAVAKAGRALAEFRVEGVPTNAAFLQSLLPIQTWVAGEATTRFVDDHLAELVAARRRQGRSGSPPTPRPPPGPRAWPA